jgi:hypothetical protein
MGRTFRRRKTGGKAIDSRCRNHGTCQCVKERQHKNFKKILTVKEKMDEYDEKKSG